MNDYGGVVWRCLIVLPICFEEKCWSPRARTADHDVTVRTLLPLRYATYCIYRNFDFCMDLLYVVYLKYTSSLLEMKCRLRLT